MASSRSDMCGTTGPAGALWAWLIATDLQKPEVLPVAGKQGVGARGPAGLNWDGCLKFSSARNNHLAFGRVLHYVRKGSVLVWEGVRGAALHSYIPLTKIQLCLGAWPQMLLSLQNLPHFAVCSFAQEAQGEQTVLSFS